MVLSDTRLAVLVPHLYEECRCYRPPRRLGCRNGLLDGGWPAISPMVRPGCRGGPGVRGVADDGGAVVHRGRRVRDRVSDKRPPCGREVDPWRARRQR